MNPCAKFIVQKCQRILTIYQQDCRDSSLIAKYFDCF